jgi:hypothetical protein
MTKNSMLRMFVKTRLVGDVGRHTAVEHALNKSRRPLSGDLFVGAPWFDERNRCIVKGRSDGPTPRSRVAYAKHRARMRQRANKKSTK